MKNQQTAVQLLHDAAIIDQFSAAPKNRPLDALKRDLAPVLGYTIRKEIEAFLGPIPAQPGAFDEKVED